MIPIAVHPQRQALIDEAHARPFRPLVSPERISHVALLSVDGVEVSQHDRLGELCRHYSVAPPAADAAYFAADLNGIRLRWERHTEFSTFTFYEHGPFRAPFDDPPINRVPQDWLASLPGQVLVATHLTVEPRPGLSGRAAASSTRDYQDVARVFGSDDLVGAIVIGRMAEAYADFRTGSDGFSRILVYDRGLRGRQAGRLVQRLLEIETYRLMALLALPVARAAGPQITIKDRRLAAITQELADKVAASGARPAGTEDTERERTLLARLTELAAEIEQVTASSDYRFSAAAAYYALVERRIEELREERIEGLQQVFEFMDRRLAPAMRTCQSVAARQRELSARVSRASQLLRARVDVALEQQNRDLLRSMDRRARLQLRLQETVEGLSVVAITYYAASLVGYGAKGLKAAGWIDIPPDLATGIAAPVLLLCGWIGLKRMRRVVLRDKAPADRAR